MMKNRVLLENPDQVTMRWPLGHARQPLAVQQQPRQPLKGLLGVHFLATKGCCSWSCGAGDEGQVLALVLGPNFENRLGSSIVLIITSVVMLKWVCTKLFMTQLVVGWSSRLKWDFSLDHMILKGVLKWVLWSQIGKLWLKPDDSILWHKF